MRIFDIRHVRGRDDAHRASLGVGVLEQAVVELDIPPGIA